ncbi:MAG: methyltransferase domain-containing protein [Planctomycetota bacterium JB042]
MSTEDLPPLDVETAVRTRYSGGAREREEALCCPVPADPKDVDFLPAEVVEKDYGCGDPSRFVREGDVVLDLGSGAGRVCFVAARRVGPNGRVIGVDMNDDMLEVAERNRPIVAERLGYEVCEFRKGRIQDLRLDVARLDARLRERPVAAAADLDALRSEVDAWRRDAPLIADESVDLVVSNCVLNLVREEEKRALFSEIHRVVRRGGRVAISDIVVDEDLPEAMRNDPDLWSGCLSGAFREDLFLRAFEEAGFHAIEIESRGDRPWRVVDGYEFRSLTVTARKGKEGPCLERNQAVVYRGPWREVLDDDGHRLTRGDRIAVCDKTYRILTSAPYADSILGIPPYVEVPLEDAAPFACSPAGARRPAGVTKGEGAPGAVAPPESCGPDCC